MMGGIYKQKQKSKSLAADLPARLLSKQLNARLSSAAGISKLQTRDPVYELSDLLKTHFDSFGSAAAQKEAGEQEEDHKTADTQRQNGGFSDKNKVKQQDPDFPSYAHSTEQTAQQSFYHRFSQTAFNNGKLAGAVLQGGGKGMFVSCLKRAFGVTMTPTDKQKTVYADSAANLPVANFPARAVFNRCVHGAASIVFDSTMETDRMLELLAKLAAGDTGNLLENSLPDSYHQLFPFLSTEAEASLRDELQQSLRSLDAAQSSTQQAVQKRAVLDAALKKADAIIGRKNQMKTDFTIKLRELLGQLHKAEAFFSSDTLVTELADKLFDAEAPEDGGEDDDSKKRRRGNKKNTQ